MRAGSLLLLCAGAALITPASAPASDVLTAETTVRGKGGTYAEVRLDAPLRAFTARSAMSVELEGDGDVLAVDVRRSDVPRDPQIASVPSIHARRVGDAGSTTFRLSFARLENGLLPAGVYRIYLLSDRPATARLRFLDGAGRSSVTTASPFPFHAEELPQRRLPDGTVTFGAQHEIVTRQSLMFLNVVRPPSEVVQRLEVCYYGGGGAEAAGDGAFAPGCPGGQSIFARTSGETAQPETFTVLNPPPGADGIGGNLSHIGAEAVPFAAAAWASFIEDLAVPATPQPQPAAPVPPSLELLARRLRLRGSSVVVPVRCARNAECRGYLSFPGARTRRFRLAEGAQARLRLRVPARARRTVRRRGSTRITLTAALETASGPIVQREALRLRR